MIRVGPGSGPFSGRAPTGSRPTPGAISTGSSVAAGPRRRIAGRGRSGARSRRRSRAPDRTPRPTRGSTASGSARCSRMPWSGSEPDRRHPSRDPVHTPPPLRPRARARRRPAGLPRRWPTELDLPVTQVTNHLAWARRGAAPAAARAAAALSGSDAEFRDEAAAVLGRERREPVRRRGAHLPRVLGKPDATGRPLRDREPWSARAAWARCIGRSTGRSTARSRSRCCGRTWPRLRRRRRLRREARILAAPRASRASCRCTTSAPWPTAGSTTS